MKQEINQNNEPHKFFFMEAFPLVLIDYFNFHNNVVAHDISESDLHLQVSFHLFNYYLIVKVKTLFDEEIIGRISQVSKFSNEEEKKAKIKELLFEKLNIEKNIRNYEDMLLAKKINKENVLFLELMIDKFRDQRSQIEKKIHHLHFEMNNKQQENNNYIPAALYNTNGNVNDSSFNAATQITNNKSFIQNNYPENNYGSKYYDPTHEYKRVGHRGYGASPKGSPKGSPENTQGNK